MQDSPPLSDIDALFFWCDEAPVFENVPPVRMMNARFFLPAMLRGIANSEKVQLLSIGVAKSLGVAVLYTRMLPLPPFSMRIVCFLCLVRDCDRMGKMCADCGIKLVRQRDAA